MARFFLALFGWVENFKNISHKEQQMKKNHEFVYKFFLFSLLRIDYMTEYLEKMRSKGYKLVEIRQWCIFVFKKSEIRDDLRYVILTEHFRNDLKYSKRNWDDAEFLEKRNPRFHYTNGEQCSYYVNGVWCHVYLTRCLTDEDVSTLREYRKRHIIGINVQIIIFLIFVAVGLSLRWLFNVFG